MKFRLVTDNELDQVRHLDDATSVIQSKATALIGELAKMFNGQETRGIRGVEFTPGDSIRSIGLVKTPYGIGRMRLIWNHDGQKCRGEIVIDRELLDERDLQYWEPVFSFSLGQQGVWTPSHPPVETPGYLKHDTATRYWALGASIYYAIFKGPVV